MAKSTFDTISEFYVTNVEELRSFANKILNDTEEAKDVVQRCFLRLLTMHEEVVPVALPALLHNMVRNAAINVVKHRAIVRQYNKVESASTSVSSESPEVRIVASDLVSKVARRIDMLPEMCRTIYEMNVYGGMKLGEIATTLNLKYKFAEKQLGMARKIVRKGLRNVV